MDTKSFNVSDKIQFITGDLIEGKVVVSRDYEPSLGVKWNGHDKISWYISSSTVFKIVDKFLK